MYLFSIIIPTIGRYTEVEQLLQTIHEQAFENIEVIIVDQNESALFLQPVINACSAKLNLRHHRVNGKGASYARNEGISVASGEILMFPDDDCEFPPGILQEIEKVFTGEPGVDGICIVTRDKTNGKKMGLLKNREAVIQRENAISTVIEAGIIVKRRILGSTRFDEQMGVGSLTSRYWSDEGPDLILRLTREGARVIYRPDLYFYHPDPTRVYTAKTAVRAYQYGLGRGYFLRKHGYSIITLGYYCGIYIAGMLIGILKFDYWMVRYFQRGIKGRLEGYFTRRTSMNS